VNIRVAYGTNAFAGRNLAETESSLREHVVAAREILGASRLPIGLWLSAAALAELPDRDGTRRFRDRLAALGLDVVTLNGFPYGDFHREVVKLDVYEPSWARPERLAYTRRLAEVLADLVPDGTRDASISTLPIGWRPKFTNEGCGSSVGLAAAQLETLARDLAAIEARTGVRIHVDLEPEPGCVLDRAEHVVELFDRCLRRTGDVDPRRHLGVCHDVCHSAVMFEPQVEAIARYREAGIRVGKVQVSSAVETRLDDAEARAELARFAEPRYLHQTTVRAGGTSVAYEDLPHALATARSGIARTHFHVPIDLAAIGPLATTQADIDGCLAALGPDRPVLEIETYAWAVLPDPLRPARLAEGIAREIRWLESRLDRRPR
jgi:sugar phosphate isomerase/epimerase